VAGQEHDTAALQRRNRGPVASCACADCGCSSLDPVGQITYSRT
jgi:hypothetical protein